MIQELQDASYPYSDIVRGFGWPLDLRTMPERHHPHSTARTRNPQHAFLRTPASDQSIRHR